MSQHTPQAAAIAMSDGQICIVTTSGGKGWVVPKGNLRPGLGLADAAALEAWEEAGLKGEVIPEPIGEFIYKKKGGSYFVTAFAIEVSEVSETWPEQQKRSRKWVSIREAAEIVRYPQLRSALARFAAIEVS